MRHSDYQWSELEAFENKIVKLMDWSATKKKPLYFAFEPLSWFGNVYITKYSDVKYSVGQDAIQYTLSMEVDDGFADLLKAVTDSHGLDNIPDGIRWETSKYNTPTASEVHRTMDALMAAFEDTGIWSASMVSLFKYYTKADEKEKEPEKKENKKIDRVIYPRDAFDLAGYQKILENVGIGINTHNPDNPAAPLDPNQPGGPGRYANNPQNTVLGNYDPNIHSSL